MKSVIRDNIENGVYYSQLKYKRVVVLPEDAIVDEEKSVRWNREEVERLNEESYSYKNQWRKSGLLGEKKFRNDVINMLTKDYPFTEDVAKKYSTRLMKMVIQRVSEGS